MSGENLLAIDHGTQSVKAIVFDPLGNSLARQQIPIEPYFSSAPGLAEQQPERFWQALCQACQGLWVQQTALKETIRAVALTTQRSTVLNLDIAGQPLRPAIVWLDKRRTENLPYLGGWWGLLFRLIGLRDTVHYLQAEAEANWLARYEPQIWAKTHKFLFLSGYLTHRLVGDFVDSVGCQVGYVPFDYRRQTWAKDRDWKWQVLPIQCGQLPRLVAPAQTLGQITREAASATGIRAGTPLIAAAADKACEVLGAGAIRPDIACLSYGTAATINTTQHRYLEAIPLIPPYPSAVPGAYSMEIQIYRGFWMVTWFKEEFGYYEQELARQSGAEPETLFEKLVEAVPPGSEGLFLQPYWSPGLRHPGPEARGAVIGFGDEHTRAHFYRAILEGLAYALREGAERMMQRSHTQIRELRIAGGGSQSPAAMQLSADIFGLPASRPHLYDTSALGAAIDAAVGCGLYSGFNDAVAAMTRTRDTFDPQPRHHRIYNDLYQRVYLNMYPRLKPLYQAIRRLTDTLPRFSERFRIP